LIETRRHPIDLHSVRIAPTFPLRVHRPDANRGPNDDLCSGADFDAPRERLGQALVAHIPGFSPSGEHSRSSALGFAQGGHSVQQTGNRRVRLVQHVKQGLRYDDAFQPVVPQPHLHNLCLVQSLWRNHGLSIFSEVIEARVAIACPLRALRIHFLHVVQDRSHRSTQTI
jgi:hypothetical protein